MIQDYLDVYLKLSSKFPNFKKLEIIHSPITLQNSSKIERN